ncbi:MAG: hypothetical protein SPI30_08850 [Prevotella sp.]|nr:hypothetical protein [Prevotella sp.]
MSSRLSVGFAEGVAGYAEENRKTRDISDRHRVCPYSNDDNRNTTMLYIMEKIT